MITQTQRRLKKHFSNDCRKVLSKVIKPLHAIPKLRDWLKNLAPDFKPLRSQTKPMEFCMCDFSHGLSELIWLKATDWFKPTLLNSNSIRNALPFDFDIYVPLAREIRQKLLTLPSLNNLI